MKKLSNGIGLDYRLNFSIFSNPEMIANWNIEDFRDIIRIGNKVKYERLKCIIDIFTKPEKYINVDTGNTYVQDILGITLKENNGR